MRHRLVAWTKTALVAGGGAMVAFGLVHQVLVAPTAAVFVGAPAAALLSVPLVHGYLAQRRASRPLSGLGYGLGAGSGLVVAQLLVMAAMRGRSFFEGPRPLLYAAALASAPLVSGATLRLLTGSLRAAWLGAIGAALLAAVIGDFQSDEPDWANLGALVSVVAACCAGGVLTAWASARWLLARGEADSPVAVAT